MAKARPGQRIALSLDPRVALQAILLNRLERLPVSRRSEWLRGLLVQGFRDECRALREVTHGTEQHLEAMETKVVTAAMKTPFHPVTPNPIVRKTAPMPIENASKPFAALGKVIGQ